MEGVVGIGVGWKKLGEVSEERKGSCYFSNV